ncbi:MAG TPA: TolC family protein [Candidatus Limnocylindria bacterium]|nr:TolC family protein [Candidatus Limnocylindria bacterium]
MKLSLAPWLTLSLTRTFWLACGFSVVVTACAETTNELTREDLLRRVMARNETIQIKAFEAEIARNTFEGERGIFEPQATASVERDDNQRPNNAQQVAALGLTPLSVFSERNMLYSAGIDTLTPIGSKLHVGSTLRDSRNNLQVAQNRGREYETFVGMTVAQPLLKNFGLGATMARIRLAALASDIAYQEYRKNLMLVLSQADAAYWDLYMMQEQERISADSVGIASKVFDDSRARSDVGKGAEAEVLQAQAGVALRVAKRTEAHYKVLESISRVSGFFSEPSVTTNTWLKAVDAPSMTPVSEDHHENMQQAFKWNPDFISRQAQFAQDKIRLGFARNQRLPDLQFKGSYGFNGLGKNTGVSYGQFLDSDFPAWSVGLELHVPLLGGIREHHELTAAKVGLQRSETALSEAATQISSQLASSFSKVRTFRENQATHQSVVELHQKLLEAQMAKLEAGTIESRFVLETEDRLAEARMALVEDQVQYRRAVLEVDLLLGRTLAQRNLELSQAQLRDKTITLLKAHHVSDQKIEAYKEKAGRDFDKLVKPQ